MHTRFVRRLNYCWGFVALAPQLVRQADGAAETGGACGGASYPSCLASEVWCAWRSPDSTRLGPGYGGH